MKITLEEFYSRLIEEQFEIDVQVEPPFDADVDVIALMAAAGATLRQQNIESAALTLVITSDEEVQRLNRTYRGFDEPTDVLSFAQQDDQELSMAGPDGNSPPEDARFVLPPELQEEQERYLGDIIIAYPYTRRQAARNDRSLHTELLLMTIHGTLHLLGFDHAMPADKAHMWSLQNQVLAELGEEAIELP